MVDWSKKVQKACAAELGDEQLLGALFVQPSGAMAEAVGRGVGGLVGSMVASSAHKDGTSTEGTAKGIPSKKLVLALTPTRLLVFGHSQLSGNPKGLESTIPAAHVTEMALAPGKVSSKLSVWFADGSVKVFDAPKIGNPDRFLAAFQQAP